MPLRKPRKSASGMSGGRTGQPGRVCGGVVDALFVPPLVPSYPHLLLWSSSYLRTWWPLRQQCPDRHRNIPKLANGLGVYLLQLKTT